MEFFDHKSIKHGVVRFTCPDKGGYVRVQVGRMVDPKQICYGGGFQGNTITANPDTLKVVAMRWWRQYLEGQRHNPL